MRKFMNVTLYRPAKRVLSSKFAIPSIAGAGAVLAGASGAFASSDMAALFALVDVSGAQAAIFTVLAAMVAIGLLFFGRRLLQRTGVSV
ncbi:MAG: hypothetical protein SD837_22070 [Candidatus Electrothrix scaldis]|nr:MAG: hypothetical protein SD837_22070 [Candidatus Electrothrix sp. GW3-3]